MENNQSGGRETLTDSDSVVIWNETIKLNNNLFHVYLPKKYYYCPYCFKDISIFPPIKESISFLMNPLEFYLFGKCSNCDNNYKINQTKLTIEKVKSS
eukprot:gene4415-7790_t